MEYELEFQEGSGFFLFIEEHGGPGRTVQVSEKCYRRYVVVGAGSPPAASGYYQRSFDLFEKYERG
jgi:hypothetical protein